MKALILNSGKGSRMCELVMNQPKCMTEISPGETIISRQLKQLIDYDISEAIITTGYLSPQLMNYCRALDLPIKLRFIDNPEYEATNYIYSIYLAREYLRDDELDDALKQAKLNNSLTFIEAKCKIYSRPDLGRPRTSALDNKNAFMDFLLSHPSF